MTALKSLNLGSVGVSRPTASRLGPSQCGQSSPVEGRAIETRAREQKAIFWIVFIHRLPLNTFAVSTRDRRPNREVFVLAAPILADLADAEYAVARADRP